MRTVSGHQLNSKLQQTLAIGPHRLIADVDASMGGDDAGPNPHEYLGAALVACTAITLRMYAQRKAWDLVDAEVIVDITEENNEGTVLSRQIKLTGNLDEEQRKRLLEIANHCPIHKLLSGKVTIQTGLK